MARIGSILEVFILCFCIYGTLSLYEDQVGKFDWKQNFIGKVIYANFDSVKRVIVATEENVVACLQLKNGNISWRQVLEDPKRNQIELLHVNEDVVTVSGGDTMWYVRGWDLNSGALLYEWTLSIENKFKASWTVSGRQLLHVLPVPGSCLEVTTYQLDTGQNRGKTLSISAPWITDLPRCVLTGTYWSCISQNNDQLVYMDIKSEANRVYTWPVSNLLSVESGKINLKAFKYSEPAVLLEQNSLARLVILQPESPKIILRDLVPTVVAASSGDDTVLVQFNGNSAQKFTALSINIDGDFEETKVDVDYQSNSGTPQPLAAICRGSACRILFSSSDDALSLLQLPAGKVLWTREEALSQLVAAEFVELPVSELDASIEHEFDIPTGDAFRMLYRRLLSQARQLAVLLTGNQLSSNSSLVRDEFGLHKVIIVATKVGKLFALDSLSGEIVWSKSLTNIQAFSTLETSNMLLLIQRTARHAPLPSQCVLLARDATTGHGIVYIFNPITGDSEFGVERLPYHIKQAMLLPQENEDHLKGLLILSDDNKIQVIPKETKSVFNEYANSVFLYSTDLDTNMLQGYSLANSEDPPKAVVMWNLNLGQAKIIAHSVRPSNERVHSQGRVLSDRSTLYKYVNPNLFALATLVDDPLHKHVLSVYLIDGVTGLVVYSVSHKRASGPVHLVHSENWLVYAYNSDRFRRTEVVAVELYEGMTQSNSTAFSSHAVSQLPQAESQAYILPGTPLVLLPTLTERGITSKHLLLALSNGAVTEIPWAFLEPRRRVDAPSPEEGYFPYMPELPLPAEASINYYQNLARIRGLQVGPARLESTCLVLAYGLDLFYTRVAPSKTFDVLKEDFDHWLIVMVLTALGVASYITKRLASRKALKQAWK